MCAAQITTKRGMWDEAGKRDPCGGTRDGKGHAQDFTTAFKFFWEQLIDLMSGPILKAMAIAKSYCELSVIRSGILFTQHISEFLPARLIYSSVHTIQVVVRDHPVHWEVFLLIFAVKVHLHRITWRRHRPDIPHESFVVNFCLRWIRTKNSQDRCKKIICQWMNVCCVGWLAAVVA